jgi:hypothetical protein
MHSSLDVKVFRIIGLDYDEIPHLSSVVAEKAFAAKEVCCVQEQQPRTERGRVR